MKVCFEKRKTISGRTKLSFLAAAALAIPFTLAPVLAGAVETDRVTVEDPSNGQIMFRVTSAGNVTGASFSGDGSGLSNVPHFKGAWSGATAYAKDDCVSYGGSSYIALQASSDVQPNLDPAFWAILAQKGQDGTTGTQGPEGPQGQQGPPGQPGTNGSPDTQAQILGKLAAQADGAVLQMQQGASDLATAAKLEVKDKNGVSKFSVSPQVVKIGDANASVPPIEVYGGVVGSDMITFKRTVGTNLQFGLSLAGGGITFSNRTAGTSNLFLTTYSGVPTAVIGLDNYSGAGKDAWIRPGGANVNSTTNAAGSSLILSAAPQTGTGTRGEVRLQTYPAGTSGTQWTTPVTRVKVKPDGELQVLNGLQVSTTSAKPACDINSRGMVWVTQGEPNDALEVCLKQNGSFVWKAL